MTLTSLNIELKINICIRLYINNVSTVLNHKYCGFSQHSTPCVDQPSDPIEQEIPDLYLSCAVTRAMAKKAKLYDGMQDINLTDTLIGQSF